MKTKIKICLAGATGWTGSALCRAIAISEDLELVGAVANSTSGQNIGTVLGIGSLDVLISPDVETALQTATDVLIDYTNPKVVFENTQRALREKVSVVVGTSGLTAQDYSQLEILARAQNVGVIAAGNFSLTAALAKHFSLIAAKYLPHREIIDYASATKIDVPSGTARELAEALATAQPNQMGRAISEILGPREARGAIVEGTPVHSLRLPGYTLAFETLFGLPDERLTIRHDAGRSAAPYVAGTLLAARKVGTVKGVIRGLDQLLFSNLH